MALFSLCIPLSPVCQYQTWACFFSKNTTFARSAKGFCYKINQRGLGKKLCSLTPLTIITLLQSSTIAFLPAVTRLVPSVPHLNQRLYNAGISPQTRQVLFSVGYLVSVTECERTLKANPCWDCSVITMVIAVILFLKFFLKIILCSK